MATSAQQGAGGGEWRSYGGDTGSTKYTPLAQITPENVGDLAVAWRWESVDGQFDLDELRAQYPALQIGNDTSNVSINGLKGTPLMVGDTLYLSTALSQVAAIDAVTGETRWVHDPKSYAAGIPIMVLGFSSRGLAYWTDGQAERIIWATGDAMLHAVDAATGESVPEFGDGGSVDLMRGIWRARRDPPPINYSVTSPPVVCNDVVIVGSAVSDQPRFKESPSGYVRGFDALTGALRWTFRTVPLPGEFGHDTWRDGSAGYTGNANVWTMMSADPELGYAYLPVGNATNDHYGGHRPGTNLFANSLVCVECATGERVWHYQLVHHDLWDYDPPAAPNLVDITVDGRAIKAVAQVTKQAFTFVFDRVTGDPVWPIEERAVPSSDVPGEWTAPTQPFPTKPPPYDRQGATEADLIDFTPELHADAVEILQHYVHGPIFTPPSLIGTGPGDTRGTIELPGYTGGANWSGAAFDPDTGLLYVPSTTQPIIPALVEAGSRPLKLAVFPWADAATTRARWAPAVQGALRANHRHRPRPRRDRVATRQRRRVHGHPGPRAAAWRRPPVAGRWPRFSLADQHAAVQRPAIARVGWRMGAGGARQDDRGGAGRDLVTGSRHRCPDELRGRWQAVHRVDRAQRRRRPPRARGAGAALGFPARRPSGLRCFVGHSPPGCSLLAPCQTNASPGNRYIRFFRTLLGRDPRAPTV